MSTSFTPGDSVQVVSGRRNGHTGEVVDVSVQVRVRMDGSGTIATFDPIELAPWRPLSRTLGALMPTRQDAKQDWGDGSFYDLVAAVTPQQRVSSQAGLQALKFRIAR